MPFPVSIANDVSIPLKNGTHHQEILTQLVNDLKEVGCEVIVKEDHLRLTRCEEFSSGMSTFKYFNKGNIVVIRTNKQVTLQFRIFLVEHLILFLGVLIMGAFGIYQDGFRSNLTLISLILLLANFIFNYLFAVMALNTFVFRFTKVYKGCAD